MADNYYISLTSYFNMTLIFNSRIFLKYANSEYLEKANAIISKLQEKFPNIKLKSFNEFEKFLSKAVPILIKSYMVSGKAVKVCSSISPDFAEIAANNGFAVLTETVPGHYRNIFISDECPYVIDLSYIQFTCGYTGYNQEKLFETLKEIYNDPFKAIKIEKLPQSYIYDDWRFPHGKYDEMYNPVKSFDFYDKNQDFLNEDYQSVLNILKKLKSK